MDLKTVLDNIPTMAVDAVCVAHRLGDEEAYSVTWVNDAFCSMFATTHQAASGMDPFGLYHWDYVADFKFAMEEMLSAGRTSFVQDTLCLRADGSSFWGGVSFVKVPDDNGAGEYTITFVRDIDELKNREQSAELALIENQHLLAKIEAVQVRLMSAINMSSDPFCIFDARDRLVIWNPAFAENVALDPEALKSGTRKKDIIEMSVANGFIDDAVGREEEYLKSYLDAWSRGEMVSQVMRIQGRDYKATRSLAPNGDHVMRCVDISEHLRQQRELERYAERLEEANREISEQAMHDELTGLGNRRYLKRRLEDMIEAKENTGLEMAALHIDLDRFKKINDTMGHAAGDHVLRCVADILRSRVRAQDVVTRIGGDEFVVLMLCEAESDSPKKLADRLIEEICKPIPYDDRPCRLGASVGIARTPMIPAEDLLMCSDIALYRAKTGERAMTAIFDHGDLETLKSSKQLADDIQRGIEEGEFEPVYQPQFDIETGEIVAIEVLAYWAHPARGPLPTNAFFDTAMDIQMEGKIDALVSRKAIAECTAFFEGTEKAPTLSFNVSLSRLMDENVIGDLSASHYPGRIAFELTESVFLEEENPNVLERLDVLRALGVSLEVDDFGSGRASIVGLRRIEPDFLKIDRRLIEPITSSESARRLVASIVEIGRALDIGVTAVGVETEGQMDRLKALGCERGQGFHFAAPGSLSAMPLVAGGRADRRRA